MSGCLNLIQKYVYCFRPVNIDNEHCLEFKSLTKVTFLSPWSEHQTNTKISESFLPRVLQSNLITLFGFHSQRGGARQLLIERKQTNF